MVGGRWERVRAWTEARLVKGLACSPACMTASVPVIMSPLIQHRRGTGVVRWRCDRTLSHDI